MSYQQITNLKCIQIKNKSILIIGSGYMAEHYASALFKMGLTNVTIIGNTKNNVNKICKQYNFKPLDGGFKNNLPNINPKDLVIVATPIPLLIPATKLALKFGHKSILIEKPGALHSRTLRSLKNIYGVKIRLGYNRLQYPSFYKLLELIEKDSGITSCHFTFTERIHTINFDSHFKSVLERWGISNSLHVISMAVKLIGIPKKINCYQKGYLSWHKSGSIFVGCGISSKNIPFSYYSDWNSAGGWSIDVMTRKNWFKLQPLEQLQLNKKGSTVWKNVKLKKSFPNVKDGIAEEIFEILSNPQNHNLVTLKEGSSYIKLAEKIFNYK